MHQAIVLRLLSAAGFDLWNPLEVSPEESNAAKNRPDLIVACGGDKENKAFVLEIKRRNAELTDGELGQALSYVGHMGIRWTWLTDSPTCIVADEKKPGAYPECVVLTLELLHSETGTFAENLYQLLERGTWRGGQFESALRRVQDNLEERNKRERILKEKQPVLEAFASENTISDRG